MVLVDTAFLWRIARFDRIALSFSQHNIIHTARHACLLRLHTDNINRY
jgi:hypothetical protein